VDRPGGSGGAPARAGDLVVTRHGARFLGRRLSCAIGRGGIVPAGDKREGDGATPAGAWRLTRVLWRADRLARPRTALPCVPVGPADGWSDAPEDDAYNRPVRLPHPFSAERLSRADPLYDLLAVTDHNAGGAPGRGSAVFLHCWRAPRHPTAGCIAFRPGDLSWILARWRAGCRVLIAG
jgi:L,D-peptidoglycan transpeptidase YkuD (ErfK/YbiS/YcfS/YnhG family)